MKFLLKCFLPIFASIFISCEQTLINDWIVINDSGNTINFTINKKNYSLLQNTHMFLTIEKTPQIQIAENQHMNYFVGSYYKDSFYNMIKFTPQPKFVYYIQNQTDLSIVVQNGETQVTLLNPSSEYSVVFYNEKPDLSCYNESFPIPYLENYSNGIFYITIYK